MKKSKKNPELATTKSRLELKRRDFFTLLGGGVAVYLSSRNPSGIAGTATGSATGGTRRF